MNSENFRQLKPFCSVLILIFTFFFLVFLQMEERRLGYSVLKLSREHKKILEDKRVREIQLVKVTRPQLVEHMAHSKFTLKKIQAEQIIHLSGTANLVELPAPARVAAKKELQD
ncbi:MAG: histidine kinase [Pseudobdellovibrionaceae bacterium]